MSKSLFILALTLATAQFSPQAFASCSASQRTIDQVESTRFQEGRYEIVLAKVARILGSDKCLKDSLSQEEIENLATRILNDNSSTAEELIGEFLAE